MLRRALSSTATRVGLIIMLLLVIPAAGLGVAAQGEESSEPNTQLVLVLEALMVIFVTSQEYQTTRIQQIAPAT